MFARTALAALWIVTMTTAALAGGPRFVTGTQYATPGVMMAFGNTSPLYYTDPGDLSKTVTHAQADAVVAAAAAVWNSPLASLVLAQGGTLDEHVSGANAYFDGSSVVFPADTAAANYQSKPIAVIYDTDGSVTDLLLGQGASDPSSCRQNEVTESVDGFGADGTIQHALLVLNGRCVTNTHDSLMQLQYMVMRTFGRVLGLGWSQTNDNVFTGSPVPTANQMAYWPVMHPIDVVCGSYTYLCMVNPFVLRPDDLGALMMLYPVTAANIRAGQTLTSSLLYQLRELLIFPGQYGMDMVNFTITEDTTAGGLQTWQMSSGVTGALYQQNAGNPVSGPEDAADNVGTPAQYVDSTAYVPLIPYPLYSTILYVEWEAINPLYTGVYAIGAFQRPPTMYAGTEATYTIPSDTYHETEWTGPANTGSTCFTTTNGTETAPHAADSSGWWTDVLCGRNRPAWGSVTIRGGRSWTLEATALDENGAVSAQKAQIVLGVWNASDATGTLPTVAAQPAPMNTASPGLTQLAVPAAAGSGNYRLTIADAYGGGRPDYGYKARILYADSVSPATVGASGGQITIMGMGFANGNRVTVNGVVAKVLSWSPTQIVAVAPSSLEAKAAAGVPVDVAVVDLTTGGSTTIAGALSYPGAGEYGLVKVSAPATVETGSTAATSFAVQVIAGDGVTPVAGASVQFAVTSGSAGLGACVVAGCVLTTNASGIAQTAVTGIAAGAITLTATAVSGGATVQVSLVDTDPVHGLVVKTVPAYVAAGASVNVPVTVNAVQDGVAASGVAVNWSVSGGAGLSAVSSATEADGAATVSVGSNAMLTGSSVVQACAWTSVCTSWTMTAVDASQWVPAVVSGAGQSVRYTEALAPVVLRVTDASGHALLGAAVNIAQTVTEWQGACPPRGRCPAAAVLASNTATLSSDVNGLVSVAPLAVAGVPQVVNMAVSAGTAGFVALTLVKGP